MKKQDTSYTTMLKQTFKPLLDLRFMLLGIPSFAYLFFSNNGANADVAWTMVYAIAVITALSAVTHSIRKVLFPYVDLKEYSYEALKNPMASAIVFAGVCYVIATVLNSAILWMK